MMSEEKKFGIDWAAIDRAVGEVHTIHPLAMVAEFVQDHPELDVSTVDKIWSAGAMLLNPDYTVDAAQILYDLTGVKKVVWLHFWSMWEASYA